MNAIDTPTYTFNCWMDPEPVGLERLFRVVRTRGFIVNRVQANHDAHGLQIQMTVSGSRCSLMLRAQLEKLCSVRQVAPQQDEREASLLATG